MLLLLLLVSSAWSHPTLQPSASAVNNNEQEESDNGSSRKVLGSSVVTSVSVILDSEGDSTRYTDAVGKPVNKPHSAAQVASPINLLNPDRYEFYTFDDNGDLVKRLMTLEEIQSIIANGDGEMIQVNPEKKVDDVVNNVQNVLKEEIKLKGNLSHIKPVLDTPDVTNSWSMILPAIFGNNGDEIIPNKGTEGLTPDTIIVEETANSTTTPTKQKPQQFITTTEKLTSTVLQQQAPLITVAITTNSKTDAESTTDPSPVISITPPNKKTSSKKPIEPIKNNVPIVRVPVIRPPTSRPPTVSSSTERTTTPKTSTSEVGISNGLYINNRPVEISPSYSNRPSTVSYMAMSSFDGVTNKPSTVFNRPSTLFNRPSTMSTTIHENSASAASSSSSAPASTPSILNDASEVTTSSTGLLSTSTSAGSTNFKDASTTISDFSKPVLEDASGPSTVSGFNVPSTIFNGVSVTSNGAPNNLNEGDIGSLVSSTTFDELVSTSGSFSGASTASNSSPITNEDSTISESFNRPSGTTVSENINSNTNNLNVASSASIAINSDTTNFNEPSSVSTIFNGPSTEPGNFKETSTNFNETAVNFKEASTDSSEDSTVFNAPSSISVSFDRPSEKPSRPSNKPTSSVKPSTSGGLNRPSSTTGSFIRPSDGFSGTSTESGNFKEASSVYKKPSTFTGRPSSTAKPLSTSGSFNRPLSTTGSFNRPSDGFSGASTESGNFKEASSVYKKPSTITGRPSSTYSGFSGASTEPGSYKHTSTAYNKPSSVSESFNKPSGDFNDASTESGNTKAASNNPVRVSGGFNGPSTESEIFNTASTSYSRPSSASLMFNRPSSVSATFNRPSTVSTNANGVFNGPSTPSGSSNEAVSTIFKRPSTSFNELQTFFNGHQPSFNGPSTPFNGLQVSFNGTSTSSFNGPSTLFKGPSTPSTFNIINKNPPSPADLKAASSTIAPITISAFNSLITTSPPPTEFQQLLETAAKKPVTEKPILFATTPSGQKNTLYLIDQNSNTKIAITTKEQLTTLLNTLSTDGVTTEIIKNAIKDGVKEEDVKGEVKDVVKDVTKEVVTESVPKGGNTEATRIEMIRLPEIVTIKNKPTADANVKQTTTEKPQSNDKFITLQTSNEKQAQNDQLSVSESSYYDILLALQEKLSANDALQEKQAANEALQEKLSANEALQENQSTTDAQNDKLSANGTVNYEKVATSQQNAEKTEASKDKVVLSQNDNGVKPNEDKTGQEVAYEILSTSQNNDKIKQANKVQTTTSQTSTIKDNKLTTTEDQVDLSKVSVPEILDQLLLTSTNIYEINTELSDKEIRTTTDKVNDRLKGTSDTVKVTSATTPTLNSTAKLEGNKTSVISEPTSTQNINQQKLEGVQKDSNPYNEEDENDEDEDFDDTTSTEATINLLLTENVDVDVTEPSLISSIEELIQQAVSNIAVDVNDGKERDKIGLLVENMSEKPMSQVQLETATSASSLVGIDGADADSSVNRPTSAASTSRPINRPSTFRPTSHAATISPKDRVSYNKPSTYKPSTHQNSVYSSRPSTQPAESSRPSTQSVQSFTTRVPLISTTHISSISTTHPSSVSTTHPSSVSTNRTEDKKGDEVDKQDKEKDDEDKENATEFYLTAAMDSLLSQVFDEHQGLTTLQEIPSTLEPVETRINNLDTTEELPESQKQTTAQEIAQESTEKTTQQTTQQNTQQTTRQPTQQTTQRITQPTTQQTTPQQSTQQTTQRTTLQPQSTKNQQESATKSDVINTEASSIYTERSTEASSIVIGLKIDSTSALPPSSPVSITDSASSYPSTVAVSSSATISSSLNTSRLPVASKIDDQKRVPTTTAAPSSVHHSTAVYKRTPSYGVRVPSVTNRIRPIVDDVAEVKNASSKVTVSTPPSTTPTMQKITLQTTTPVLITSTAQQSQTTPTDLNTAQTSGLANAALNNINNNSEKTSKIELANKGDKTANKVEVENKGSEITHKKEEIAPTNEKTPEQIKEELAKKEAEIALRKQQLLEAINLPNIGVEDATQKFGDKITTTVTTEQPKTTAMDSDQTRTTILAIITRPSTVRIKQRTTIPPLLKKEDSQPDGANQWSIVSTIAPHDTSYSSPHPVKLTPTAQQSGLEDSSARLDPDVKQFIDLCNELAFGFWSSVNTGMSAARSVFVSPFAATSLLAMVFLGARGATSGEMNEILKLDDMVTFNPHLILKNVTQTITTDDKSGVANSVILRELYSDRHKGDLLSFYKERARQFYDGHVEEVSFKEVGDVIRRRTNLILKRLTWGRIQDYIKDGSIKVKPPLAGVSVSIFQTDCSSASIEGRDGELYFVVLPSIRQRRLIPIPAVVYKTNFLAGYEPSIDATGVAIGSPDQTISTIFVVPGQQGISAPGDGLARLEKQLIKSAFKDGAWTRLLKSLIPRPGLEVQIPRFAHRSIINASVALQHMGMKDLFDSQKADLRGLNGVANDLYLSDILQINSFATCGEDGIGDNHHSEIYPATANRTFRRSRKFKDVLQPEVAYYDSELLEEPRDYQRAFHDPLHDPTLYSLPLPLRPRQARLPDAPRLRFDRPFLYFVRHNPTGLVLHMGRFNPRLLP